MYDRLKIPACRGVGEYHGTELPSIDRSGRIEHVTSKPFGDRLRRLGAGGRHAVRELVGIETRRAELPEPLEDVALPRRNPAGQRDLPHRSSAARSVFLRSRAMVSGPTPPGTGVNAPATCSTSG